ncbi:HARBI1 [Mytilus coruscus]|uniref:Putative nuclease HARBI1 n=1 Tax=Mytilus coruscus TaxID=42192 RepID=A0A6J8BR31_MYTCO|nr:HARBI1 [Mytilus coruscus]
MAAVMQVPVPPHRKEKHFRLKDDLTLNLSNEELRERYRFGREGIMFISNLVSNDISRKTKRNHALTVPQMVMVTMRFLATGSFLQVVEDTIGLHKGTVSCIVSDVLTSLCNKRDEFIKWPRNVDETRGDFYRLSGLPNILGAIDGTHVRIQAPSEDEPSFVNRKGVHSVNVQAVCDARGNFTDINANWPGSSHDSHMFRTSQIRMTPSKACKIIIACAILHNICILLNEPDIEDDRLVIDNDGDLGDRFFGDQDGRGVRDHISSTFFNR